MQTLSNFHKTKRLRRRVSLTPLIDVVFILLVFFMLGSNFQKFRSIELTSPLTSATKSAKSQAQITTIHIAQSGQYQVGANTYSLEQLRMYLDKNHSKSIQISTGANATLQDLVSLIDLTKSLSLPNINLVAPRELHR